jgi:hypothetical protein
MRTLASFAALALVAAGCGGIADAPRTDTPFVYLLLSPTPLGVVADSALWALVATVHTPVDADYLAPSSFRMQRASDGALFVWGTRPLSGALPGGYAGVDVVGGANANVILSSAGDSGGLGWRALTWGSAYTLHAELPGATIEGRTTIPARPQLRIDEVGSAHLVSWPHAAGAAGYFVRPGDYGYGRFTADTQFLWCEIPGDVPPAQRFISVVALDTNAYRYLGDSTTAQAGLTGALGLFGGAAESRLAPSTPPPSAGDASCGAP